MATARFQNLAQNSLELARQCDKLRYCTNCEVDIYMEAKKSSPSGRTTLETESGTYYFSKCDLLAGEITYSLAPKSLEEPETMSVERVKEVIKMNQCGEIPGTPSDRQEAPKKPKGVLFDNAINRFDRSEKRKRRESKKKERFSSDTPRAKEANLESDNAEEPLDRRNASEELDTQSPHKPRRKPRAGSRRRRPRTEPQEE